MTNEEKKFLEPLLRNFMEKRKANVTDADVAKAMELFGAMADGAESIYHYEHPDYGAMVKEVPDTLGQLLDNSEEHSDVISFDDMMEACSKMERSALVDAVDSLIYYWLNKWHNALRYASRLYLSDCYGRRPSSAGQLRARTWHPHFLKSRSDSRCSHLATSQSRVAAGCAASGILGSSPSRRHRGLSIQ